MGYSERVLAPGMEVMPGYYLVSWLGRGAFGDVWQAVASDNAPCALKVIDTDPDLAEREARGLGFMKGVRHPHLLEIRGVFRLGGAIAVSMELAGESLTDRLMRARSNGGAGIPGPELLEYMRQAASGIDHLNAPHHTVDGSDGMRIVHQDIKPHNLLLVDGKVKVADFGFAKALERSITGKTGGLTPAYAPPEFFQGEVNAQSDQYSLAVTYCQLRGGRLPFTGSPYQIMAQHTNGTPDLTMLPGSERVIIARALSKSRKERWPSCTEFIEALSPSVGPDDASEFDQPIVGSGSTDPTTLPPGASPAPTSTRTATWRNVFSRLFRGSNR